jgi:hypothetical protein
MGAFLGKRRKKESDFYGEVRPVAITTHNVWRSLGRVSPQRDTRARLLVILFLCDLNQLN